MAMAVCLCRMQWCWLQVTVGKLADMVIVDGDPLQDITLLQHKIVLVIKGGEVYVPDSAPDF